MNLKPQDILILLKIVSQGAITRYSDLAHALYMSSSEVHAAIKRAGGAGLFDIRSKQIKRQALLEFLIKK